MTPPLNDDQLDVLHALARRTGRGLTLEQLAERTERREDRLRFALSRVRSRGLVEPRGDRWRVTRAGLLAAA